MPAASMSAHPKVSTRDRQHLAGTVGSLTRQEAAGRSPTLAGDVVEVYLDRQVARLRRSSVVSEY